ncbi:MAG: hypothetical protein JXR05_09905 [Flavobacteriaceae bacterium]
MIKRIVFFLAVIVSAQAFSQRSSSSPYSFFGVGEEFRARTVEQISMGGIGVARSSINQLNFANPAALSKLFYTTYAFGAFNNDLRVKSATSNQSSSSTSISYFSFAVPLSKSTGVIFGMQPTSSVGYSLINNTEDVDGNLVDITEFSGNGSVNRIYGGIGVSLFEGFSLGFEADFLFGNIENNVINLRAGVDLGTRNMEIANIRGGSIKLGAQYETEIKEDLTISAGASVKLSNTLKATGDEYLYSFRLGAFGGQVPRDTIFAGNLSGTLERPLETVIGIGLSKKNKWYAGINYEFQNALIAEGHLDNSSQSLRYGGSNRISLGGYYIPKYNSISSYWDRVVYRAGFKYEQTGLLAKGIPSSTSFTAINDFGISFGLGLPISNRSATNLNFALEYGKKGTLDNGLLEEKYLNFRVSLSLNDLWFIKRKID